MQTTTYAGLSDLGRQRSRNDDRWGSDPAQGLFIVADGVGSTSHGDMAAALVVELLPSYVLRHFAGVDLHDGQATERLGRAVVEMCSDLHARSLTDSQLAGAGTTLVTAMVSDSRAVIAHLGDSRAYLYRDGQVRRLTSDHTLVQAVLDAGEITEEEARHHPKRSIVTRQVLMTPPAKPDVSALDLQPGDRILLCSDGLHGVVDDATLAAILAGHPDATDACRALIEAANGGGGPDNITAVVVDAGQAPTTPQPAPEPMPSDFAAPPMPAPSPQQQLVPPAPPARHGRPPMRTPPRQPWPRQHHRRLKLGLMALAVVLLVAATTGYFLWPRQTASQTATRPTAKPSAQIATPSMQTVQPTSPPAPIDLPFPGIKHPKAVAVDTKGTVYVLVVDGDKTRVLKLEVGSTTPTPLPFTGLKGAAGIAVNTAGDVYVTDVADGGRVMKLAAGQSTPTALPVLKSRDHPLREPAGVAIDSAGNVYVADTGNHRVMKLPPDSGEPVELSFAGLDHPTGVAVDSKGNVYVIDEGNNRLLKLATGSPAPDTIVGLDHPDGLAVDAAGNVYVTEGHNHLVAKLPAGSSHPIALPFTGLDHPTGVAVGPGGDVFVTDDDNGKVVKLPAG